MLEDRRFAKKGIFSFPHRSFLGDNSNHIRLITARIRNDERSSDSSLHVYKSPKKRPAGFRNSVRSTRWANLTTPPRFSGDLERPQGRTFVRKSRIFCFRVLNTAIAAYLSDAEISATFYTLYSSLLATPIISCLAPFLFLARVQ